MAGLIITIIVGISSGIVIAGAVFAFISVIGVIPRLAQKTGTQGKIMLYEDAITLGGVFGTLIMIFNFNIYIGKTIVAIFGICTGVFFGCLAVSLAEIIDVIPVMTRRTNIKKGLTAFMLSLALGKLTGSLLYFLLPNFFQS